MTETEIVFDDAAKRRKKRIEEMKRKKRQQVLFRRYLKFGAAALLLLLCVFTIVTNLRDKAENGKTGSQQMDGQELIIKENVSDETEEAIETAQFPKEEFHETKIYSASETAKTEAIDEEVVSTEAVLIDLTDHTIVAQRGAKRIVDPASMTKILSILVAAERIPEENRQDLFTITFDITNYAYQHDCSSVGFSEGEQVTVEDLFYGTILPSGGDAALALATYVAGSQEEFVKLMNQKIDELGLSETAHFANCIGLYDEQHYSSVYDIAIMLEAALDDPFCKKVLSAHTYTTSSTPEHPDGILISNLFLRRIEDKDCGGEVICAKTGYVVQSGSCAASYAEGPSGEKYICVTVNSNNKWRCIYDHVAIYSKYFMLDTENSETSANTET